MIGASFTLILGLFYSHVRPLLRSYQACFTYSSLDDDRLTMDTLDVDEQRVVRWSLRDSADVTWSYEEVSMPPTEDGGAYRGSVSAILPFSQ